MICSNLETRLYQNENSTGGVNAGFKYLWNKLENYKVCENIS